MRVGIVGGGASGLVAGAFLKKNNIDFLIMEKMETPGKKLMLTGNGRCNITNNKSPRELKKGYYEKASFIYKAISEFPPSEAMRFLGQEFGMDFTTEEEDRVFPKEGGAKGVVKKLVDYIGEGNIKTNFDVVNVSKNTLFEVSSADGQKLMFDKLILATGGRTFPHTGSNGTGYGLAMSFGHKRTPLYPALGEVRVTEEDSVYTSMVSGVSVNLEASLYDGIKKRASSVGDLLFTHKGVSGPVIREIDRDVPLFEKGWIELDFTPGRTETEVEQALLQRFKEKPNAKITTICSEFVPSSVSNMIGQRANVSSELGGTCTKGHRKAVLKELKHMELHLRKDSLNMDTSYVTRGGIELGDIDRNTMESKLVEGLYVVGEMLDIDGKTGGYNLQACMSESYVATKDICCYNLA